MTPSILEEKGYIIDSVDATSFAFSGKKLLVCFIVLVLLAMPWLQMLDLLAVPLDVQKAKETYLASFGEDARQREALGAKRDQLLSLLESQQRISDIAAEPVHLPLTLPLLYALSEKIIPQGMGNFGFSPIADLPGESTWICFKEEKGVWPLKIVISLEVRVMASPFKIEFVRLRRGERDLPLDYVEYYFAEEREQIGPALSFLAGLKKFSCTERLREGWRIDASYRRAQKISD